LIDSPAETQIEYYDKKRMNKSSLKGFIKNFKLGLSRYLDGRPSTRISVCFSSGATAFTHVGMNETDESLVGLGIKMIELGI